MPRDYSNVLFTAVIILGMQVMCAGSMVKDGLDNVADSIRYSADSTGNIAEAIKYK